MVKLKRDITPMSNLQALSLALATGFIVTCGDAVQAISDKWGEGDPPVGWPHVLLLAVMVTIGAKVAFDEHPALYGGKIQPFLAIDTSFLIFGYCVLISAAALIATFYLSAAMLATFLFVLCIWNLTILLIHMFGRKEPLKLNDPLRNTSGAHMKWWFGCLNVTARAMNNAPAWFFLDFLFAVAILAACLFRFDPYNVVLLGFLFWLVDVFLSKSFGL